MTERLNGSAMSFPSGTEYHHGRLIGHPRRPSPEKVRRGIAIIKALMPNIVLREGVLEEHQNWEKDFNDYTTILKIARQAQKTEPRVKTKNVVITDLGQVLIESEQIFGRFAIDPLVVISKTVASLHEKEKQKKPRPSREEVQRLRRAGVSEKDIWSGGPKSESQIFDETLHKFYRFLFEK